MMRPLLRVHGTPEGFRLARFVVADPSAPVDRAALLFIEDGPRAYPTRLHARTVGQAVVTALAAAHASDRSLASLTR